MPELSLKFHRIWTLLDILFLALVIICAIVFFSARKIPEKIDINTIRIIQPHNVCYTPEDQIFQAVGDDPYFTLWLSDTPKPVIGITLEISRNNPFGSGFFIYYTPYNEKPDAHFTEKWKTSMKCEVKIMDSGFRGNDVASSPFTLQTSPFFLCTSFFSPIRNIRIDIPDDSQFKLNSLIIEYENSQLALWIKRLWIIALVYWIFRVILFFFKIELFRQFLLKNSLWTSVIVFGILKLWLVQGQVLFVVNATFDDSLFIRLARHIYDGNWLGPYNDLTLIKGPFYPLWIAFIFFTGLPLLFAQHVLYIFACALVVYALKPLVKNRILIPGYLILVFNPWTFSTESLRVMREGIYPALTLIVIACLTGIYSRKESSLRHMALWAAGLGISFSAFWLTREEGMFLLPTVILILGFIAFTCRNKDTPNRIWRMILCVMPVGIWLFITAGLCTINYFAYGAFCTVELKTRQFKSAYGASQRVEHAKYQRYVCVPKETRERIYEKSPAFAELLPYLEGSIGKEWEQNGKMYLQPYPEGEIAAGWFLWAFRDAAEKAGYHNSAGCAMKFYERAAQEINNACDTGELKCGPKRASIAPVFRSEYLSLMLKTMPYHIFQMITFSQIRVDTVYSVGEIQWIQAFEDMTRCRRARFSDEPENMIYQAGISAKKLRILQAINRLYQNIMPVLTVIGALCYLITILFCFRGMISFFAVLNSGILIAVFIRHALLAYIDITTFPVVNVLYFSPCYALVALFFLTSIAGCLREFGITN